MHIRQNKFYRFELSHFQMLNLMDVFEIAKEAGISDRDVKEFVEDFEASLPEKEFPPEELKSRWKKIPFFNW